MAAEPVSPRVATDAGVRTSRSLSEAKPLTGARSGSFNRVVEYPCSRIGPSTRGTWYLAWMGPWFWTTVWACWSVVRACGVQEKIGGGGLEWISMVLFIIQKSILSDLNESDVPET